MSKRKSYTDKDFDQQFPQPGVPADEAWKQMHELLLKNNLTTPAKKDKRRRIIVFFILFCLLVSSGLIYIFPVQNDAGKIVTAKNNNKSSLNNIEETNPGKNSSDTLDTIAQRHFNDTLQQHQNGLSSTNISTIKDQQKNVLYNSSPTGNNNNSVSNNQSINKQVENISQQAITPGKITAETAISSTAKPINKSEIKDSTGKDNIAEQFSLKKVSSKTAGMDKFHFSLEWNINFSTVNNSHYFEAYNGGKQYYMWLLPSAWARMDIGKKHVIAVHVNPYNQQFAGSKTVHIEKPFIASIEPDVVTKLVKSRGYNFGLNYEYSPTNKITVSAGLNYTIQNKALYSQQEVIAFSGEIISDSIKAAGKKDASFQYLKPAYLSWDASLKYNFKKISIGAGVTKPITDLSANPDFSVRPLNGKIYLQYRFK